VGRLRPGFGRTKGYVRNDIGDTIRNPPMAQRREPGGCASDWAITDCGGPYIGLADFEAAP